MSRSFILTYFSRSFMVSVHTFTSLMHFKLIFVSHVRYGSSFILSHVVVRLLGHAWLCDLMGCSMPGSSVLLAAAAAAAVSSVVSNSVRPHERQPTRLRRPWDSPGKNTGVGCHFLLQCMKVRNESEVAQSRLTLHDPMDYQAPLSMGFSRQEYWSGLPLPSPESEYIMYKIGKINHQSSLRVFF